MSKCAIFSNIRINKTVFKIAKRINHCIFNKSILIEKVISSGEKSNGLSLKCNENATNNQETLKKKHMFYLRFDVFLNKRKTFNIHLNKCIV